MVAVVVVCRYFVYLFMLLVLKSDPCLMPSGSMFPVYDSRGQGRRGILEVHRISSHVLSSPGALNATCKQYN